MTNPTWAGVTIDPALLQNYGWYTDTVTVSGATYNRLIGYMAAALAEQATQLANAGSALVATSSTNSVAIGTGTKTLTVASPSTKGFAAGMYVVAVDGSNGANAMTGRVTSYDSTTGALVISVPTGGTTGSGTPSSWVIGISGAVGPQGATGPTSAYWGGTAGGTANALTATTGSSLSSLTAGQIVGVKVGASANSGAATLAVDSVGAIAVRKDGSALVGGELAASTDRWFQYDGTYLRLLGGSGSASGAFSDIVSVTGAGTVGASSMGKLVKATGAPYTLTLASAATLGKGSLGIKNASSTGVVTVNNSSNVAVASLGFTQSVVIVSDGSNIEVVGLGSAASAQQLDPLKMGAHIALSNGNLTVSGTGNYYELVKALSAIPATGKYYWEVSYDIAGGGQAGLATSGASVSNYVGQAANSWGYDFGGLKVSNTGSGLVTAALGSSWSAAGIIGVAYDATNGYLFFSYNGTFQGGGNPVTGASPAFTSVTGTLYPALSMANDSNSGARQLSIRFSPSAWVYPAPTGYTNL